MINSKKEKILKLIENAEQEFSSYLKGKTFLFIFDNEYFELIIKIANFMHLCGVESRLSAKNFYQQARKKRLNSNDFCFSESHNLSTAKKKLKAFADLHLLFENDSLILKNVKTDTFCYSLSITNLHITLCLDKDENSTTYIIRSLRVGDEFKDSESQHIVNAVYCKNTNEKYYTTQVFVDKKFNFDLLPNEIIGLIIK